MDCFDANVKNVTYFDSFGVEHIPEEIEKFIGNKNIISNIYRVQAYDSIMHWYFCIRFIGFMLKGKSLLEYATYSPLMIMKRMLNNTKIFSVI